MFESVAVPIHRLADGREFITATDCYERPEIAAFVRRFSNYLTLHPLMDGYVGPTPEERETMIKEET